MVERCGSVEETHLNEAKGVRRVRKGREGERISNVWKCGKEEVCKYRKEEVWKKRSL